MSSGLDVEARVPPAADNAAYGKAREPLLQLTALWRAFDARYIPRADGQYYFGFSNSWDFATSLAQDSLRAPSVFNFFEPDYRLQGADGAEPHRRGDEAGRHRVGRAQGGVLLIELQRRPYGALHHGDMPQAVTGLHLRAQLERKRLSEPRMRRQK